VEPLGLVVVVGPHLDRSAHRRRRGGGLVVRGGVVGWWGVRPGRDESTHPNHRAGNGRRIASPATG